MVGADVRVSCVCMCMRGGLFGGFRRRKVTYDMHTSLLRFERLASGKHLL